MPWKCLKRIHIQEKLPLSHADSSLVRSLMNSKKLPRWVPLLMASLKQNRRLIYVPRYGSDGLTESVNCHGI